MKDEVKFLLLTSTSATNYFSISTDDVLNIVSASLPPKLVYILR